VLFSPIKLPPLKLFISRTAHYGIVIKVNVKYHFKIPLSVQYFFPQKKRRPETGFLITIKLLDLSRYFVKYLKKSNKKIFLRIGREGFPACLIYGQRSINAIKESKSRLQSISLD
jgi:hypothetical protein